MPDSLTDRLIHEVQECEGDCTFLCSPLMATPGAIETFGVETLIIAHASLIRLASQGARLDFLQVFRRESDRLELWFMQDAPGVVTALLPEER